MSFQRTVLEKLEKIEAKQIEHTVKLAENTVVLTEHHVRASQIESRVRPIENHVLAVNAVFKWGASALAAGGSVAAILKYLGKV